MNGVCAISRELITPEAFPVREPPDPHRWLAFSVKGILLLGTYIPGMHHKRPHWDYAIEVAAGNTRTLIMILGDVNTGKHHTDEAGATFLYPEYIEKIESLGWVEAWRGRHPSAAEYTWYSNAGNGFRIDHAYLSPALASLLVAANYSHEERERKISDHSIYLIELGGGFGSK